MSEKIRRLPTSGRRTEGDWRKKQLQALLGIEAVDVNGRSDIGRHSEATLKVALFGERQRDVERLLHAFPSYAVPENLALLGGGRVGSTRKKPRGSMQSTLPFLCFFHSGATTRGKLIFTLISCCYYRGVMHSVTVSAGVMGGRVAILLATLHAAFHATDTHRSLGV